jgi:hypothetical protein
MNDSYSIDFSGKPQPEEAPKGKGSTPESKQLMADSMKVLFKSLVLKKIAEKAMMAVMAFCVKYKNVKPDSVDYETREKIYAEAEELMGVWRVSIQELKKLDEEYEEVRKRVNAYYGKEIMPKREYPPGVKEMYDEVLGDADSDWWKRGEEPPHME